MTHSTFAGTYAGTQLLTIEKARFGEKRIIESEHERRMRGYSRPSFWCSPLLKMRYGMPCEMRPLHIDARCQRRGDILIAIADDGLGMEEDQVKNL